MNGIISVYYPETKQEKIGIEMEEEIEGLADFVTLGVYEIPYLSSFRAQHL